jgi:hypothetical protein
MIHPGMASIHGCWLDAPHRRITNGLGRRLRGEPLRNVMSLERRRVPRTFWGSNEPRAEALTSSRVTLPSLIQMDVWCALATDVQPRARKTGCAWTDNRESSDASTRRRFRTPLDKGPVNGCLLYGGQFHGSKFGSGPIPAGWSRRSQRRRALGIGIAAASALFVPHFEQRMRWATDANVADGPTIHARAAGAHSRAAPHWRVMRTRKWPNAASSSLMHEHSHGRRVHG